MYLWFVIVFYQVSLDIWLLFTNVSEFQFMEFSEFQVMKSHESQRIVNWIRSMTPLRFLCLFLRFFYIRLSLIASLIFFLNFPSPVETACRLAASGHIGIERAILICHYYIRS